MQLCQTLAPKGFPEVAVDKLIRDDIRISKKVIFFLKLPKQQQQVELYLQEDKGRHLRL